MALKSEEKQAAQNQPYGASVLVKSNTLHQFEGIHPSTDIPDFSDANKSMSSFNTPNKVSEKSRRVSALATNQQEDYIKKLLGKP